MGSECAIHMIGTEPVNAIRVAAAGEAEVRRIESRFSRFRDDSDLARINRAAAAGGSIDIDDETLNLVNHAFEAFTASDGAFDITSGLLRSVWDFSVHRLPDPGAIEALRARIGLEKVTCSGHRLQFALAGMELDFGGIGKEYAADRAAEVCRQLGVRYGFVNLAGDIAVIGPQPDGSPWQIGIRHPREADTLMAGVPLCAGGLATSGDYERFFDIDGRRYCHILDPRTGWPAEGLASVTLVAESCLSAGSLATAAMVKGRAGARWLRERGARHIIFEQDGGFSGTEPMRIMR